MSGASWDALQRAHYRARNIVSRVWLRRGDDSKQSTQTWQIEGYQGEIRESLHRVQDHGFTSLPPVGSAAVVVYQGGHRGHGMVLGGEHPKYRPTGLKPGEFLAYVVSGAAGDGTGGTMRPNHKGTLDGHGQLTGIEIDIGDSSTTTVIIKGSTKVTVTTPECDISNGGALQPVKLADGSNSTVLKAQ
jgi:phage baseplate assembly protein V